MHSFTGMRVVCLLALIVPAWTTETERANPLGKVIELLDVLGKQLVVEAKEDKKVYMAVSELYQKEEADTSAIVKKEGDKIAQLEGDLKEAEAFRAGKNLELGDLANEIAKNEGELTAATKGRKEERAVFLKNEDTFIESIDQLERALATMAKKAPAAAASASASFLDVADRLKATLKSSEFQMTTAQRETLDGFMRIVQVQQQTGPSFLQTGSRGPYGDYEGKGAGVVSTLTDLKGKVETERDAALTEENKQKKEFTTFEAGLKKLLENQKRSMADIKGAIAQSQESSSKKQAVLMEAQQIYSTEVKHLARIENEFKVKTQGYRIRLGKRADESVAVHEAQRILNSKVAKDLIKKQSIGSNFLQIAQEDSAAVRRKALHVIRSATTPGLMLLALKATVHHRYNRFQIAADPFAKVKSMIKGMLVKLNQKQAEEGKHAAYCEEELGKTTSSQKRKGEDVQKLKDRLSALSVELTQTKEDIASANKDLKSVSSVSGEAKTIRTAESKSAVVAIREYKNGVALLEKAAKVLKGFYHDEESVQVKKNEFKQRKGLGSGIIGILEIAIDDFKQLYKDAKEAEDAAAKDFQEVDTESAVRIGVFNKDLEWKGRTKVKLEFDESSMTNDLASSTKEYKAIESYMAQLKTSCTHQGPTYAEKKAKREAELASLKEALTYISSSR